MPSRDYPPEVVDKALELGATIGVSAAARRLAIPRGTVDQWTRHPDYVERWAELRRINAPKWRERAAMTMEELVDEYASVEADALDKAKQQLPELEPRDMANFLRSVATAKGITADHVGKLRGQPAVIVEHTINAERIEQAMTALLKVADETVEGTAVEVTEPVEALPAPPAESDYLPQR